MTYKKTGEIPKTIGFCLVSIMHQKIVTLCLASETVVKTVIMR